MLVDIRWSHSVSPNLGQALPRRLAVTVKACLRRTDIVGWYRAGNVLGVLLDQPRQEPNPDTADVIRQRLSRALDRTFGQTVAREFRVRLHQYGGQPGIEAPRTTQVSFTTP
jgi:hypothetical protein